MDTNVLTESHRMHYNNDFCPGFWSALITQHNLGCVLSIDRVKDEIERGKDWLHQWVCNSMPAACFASTKEKAVIGIWGKCQAWANARSPRFDRAALSRFAEERNADSWLVAYAAVHGLTVVTREQPEPKAIHSVKLPDVCSAMGVDCTSPFDMLRTLRVVLVEKT